LNFIHDDFLLQSQTARRLFQEYAAQEPILDFHSHLPASEIAENRRFRDLTEIWLEGDHYKWRAMRANGIAERYCSGNATPFEKFLAWAKTVPFTLRNPLYQWTHLELKRYFGIDELLDERNAQSVWERANALLSTDQLRAKGILRKFGVRVVCTTDDPTSDLSAHARVNSTDPDLRIYPTFRPDRALAVDNPEAFNGWVARLEAASNTHIHNLNAFLDALSARHEAFHRRGGRLSDHGLAHCYAQPCSPREAEEIFARARSGRAATLTEQEQYRSFLMLFFGRLDTEKNWTKQLHLGALRSVNSEQGRLLGADTGFDSIGDFPQAQALVSYLDLLEREHALPKMILYNVNPADNYVLATAAGSFHDSSTKAKIQFGSAWWFLDQKQGIEAQLDALSNTGLLSRFVGMVTDSRSFMSFPRHEYFRRLLANSCGREMETGELPPDRELVGGMIRNICFQNAQQYLGLELPGAATSGSR